MPTKTDNGDALSNITGDWVLFHPVYTAEEVNAVKVSGIALATRASDLGPESPPSNHNHAY